MRSIRTAPSGSHIKETLTRSGYWNAVRPSTQIDKRRCVSENGSADYVVCCRRFQGPLIGIDRHAQTDFSLSGLVGLLFPPRPAWGSAITLFRPGVCPAGGTGRDDSWRGDSRDPARQPARQGHRALDLDARWAGAGDPGRPEQPGPGGAKRHCAFARCRQPCKTVSRDPTKERGLLALALGAVEPARGKPARSD